MKWQRSTFSDLFSLNRSQHGNKQEDDNKVSPFFFAGTWHYYDKSTNRNHELEIQPNFNVILDGKLLKTQVEKVSRFQLSFIDTYGYRLVINANEFSPISIFDEANNETYPLTS
ncbi:DUF4828 domain-containing protein [Pediococcus argentinicus]|uniref:DUF4828 domain-containing protein n=1 Tax=Pediococcus argentinicus TaxID=480391 RepID=UPI00338DB909